LRRCDSYILQSLIVHKDILTTKIIPDALKLAAGSVRPVSVLALMQRTWDQYNVSEDCYKKSNIISRIGILAYRKCVPDISRYLMEWFHAGRTANGD
jgi:hypothetical protein